MEILDGIHRIDAEVGGRPLYLYLFLGERNLLLDAGCATTVGDTILPYLDSLGLGPRDIDLLVITHSDLDHQGGAHALARANPDLTVACGALDRELVSDPDAIMAQRYGAFRVDHGIDYDGETTAWMREMCGSPRPVDAVYGGGETIDLGGNIELHVLHVPGHSPGHLALHDTRTGALFSGDCVQGSVYLGLDGTRKLCPTYTRRRPVAADDRQDRRTRTERAARLPLAVGPRRRGGCVPRREPRVHRARRRACSRRRFAEAPEGLTLRELIERVNEGLDDAVGARPRARARVQPAWPRRAAGPAVGEKRGWPRRLPREGEPVKITRIDTLRLDEFPSLVYVLVHTDEGLVGLGETFFFAARSRGARPRTVAQYLLGKDPRRSKRMRARLRGYLGTAAAAPSARGIGDRHRTVGSLRQGGRSAAAPRRSAALAGLDPHLQHVRRVPLHPRESGQAVITGACRREAEGPYEDLDAFLNSADELARDLLAQGITGMKIWPFDPYAEASLGHDISIRRSRSRARAVQEDSCGGRPGDRRDGGTTRALGCAGRVPDRACARRVRARLDRRSGTRLDTRRARRGSARDAVAARVGETLTGLASYRDLITRGGARIVVFDVGWWAGDGGAQDRRAGRGVRAPVAPHDCTGPVVYTAATHLSMHLPNAMIQESVRAFWSGWYGELVTALPVIENGMVAAPDGPASERRFARRSSSERIHISARLS